MWIRTSDKKRVLFCGTVGKLEVDRCTEKVSKVLLNGEELGRYNTEERAIDVLDEICNAYLNLNIAKGGEFFGMNSSMGYFGGYVKNGVFQMPEV